MNRRKNSSKKKRGSCIIWIILVFLLLWRCSSSDNIDSQTTEENVSTPASINGWDMAFKRMGRGYRIYVLIDFDNGKVAFCSTSKRDEGPSYSTFNGDLYEGTELVHEGNESGRPYQIVIKDEKKYLVEYYSDGSIELSYYETDLREAVHVLNQSSSR